MQLHKRTTSTISEKGNKSHEKHGGRTQWRRKKENKTRKRIVPHSIADACHCLVADAAAAVIAMDATMPFSFTTSKEKWMLLTHTLIQFLISRW